MDGSSFKEVTEVAGINNVGQTFGASWGDFNGDTLPDLYVSNHYRLPTLYQNEGDGTFTDVTLDVMQEPDGFLQGEWGDQHAAAWADFDNDGDLDLLQVVGAEEGEGQGDNQLYVNDGEKLVDRATALGVDYSQSRGRTPLWLDYDNDGLLDLVLAASERPDNLAPPTIYRQTGSRKFEDERSTTGFTPSTINRSFAVLADLSEDDSPELMYRSEDHILTIYDRTTIPFEEVTDSLIAESLKASVVDLATADFNGDLLTDIFLARSKFGFPDLVQTNSNRIQTNFIAFSNETGVTFSTPEDVTFKLNQLSPNDIYIGAAGWHPNDLEFTLTPDNSEVEGIFPRDPGEDRGLYIGYDPAEQSWSMLWSSSNRWDSSAAIIESTEPISEVASIGFEPGKQAIANQLLENSNQGLVDTGEATLNSIPNNGVSVVAGDFDNDMDVDAFVIQTSPAGNQPSLLYENQGDGTFSSVPNSAGAVPSELGRANSVVSADYDLDGFLDLFVTNGAGAGSFRLFNSDGPHQLFQNQGNENHWLEIDLEGVESNRDGIGAKVFVTASGVTQVREQSGGMHYAAQNHSRIHFGLAENTVVDELVVQWPNGKEQRVENIPADQLIQVTEPSDSASLGRPEYDIGAEEGVFLWQDTPDGLYSLRVNGGNAATNFEVELISTSELIEASPVGLETNDELEVTQFGFSLNSQIIDAQDGIDFSLEPGAKALLSVTKEGYANPRQLNVGSAGSQLAPARWIVGSDELPQRLEFELGEDLGLFLGRGAEPETIEFRANGDGNFHQTALSVFSNEGTAEFSPVGLDSTGKGADRLMRSPNGVEIQGNIGTGLDGLDVITTEPVQLGFAYQQDNLFQSHWVNPDRDFLGFQNAYWLPSFV